MCTMILAWKSINRNLISTISASRCSNFSYPVLAHGKREDVVVTSLPRIVSGFTADGIRV